MSITEKQYNCNTPTPIQYFRCPGCFHWTAKKDGSLFPVGALDDKKSYTLCPRCAIIIDNEEVAKPHLVRAIMSYIGTYAGWGDADE